MASERALMQKMLDELKQQFDLTVEREMAAQKEAVSLRDQLSSANQALATIEATYKQQLAQAQADVAAANARASEQEQLRLHAESALIHREQDWQVERSGLEQRMLTLERALIESQNREQDTAKRLEQALLEGRGIREELVLAHARLKERNSQLEGAQDREDYAVATVRDMETELHQLFDRWWEENRESRDREQILTSEQYQAKITLAETVGSSNARAVAHNSHMMFHPHGFGAPRLPMQHLPARAYQMVQPPPKMIQASRDNMLTKVAADLRDRSQVLSSVHEPLRSMSPYGRSTSPGRHPLPTAGRFDRTADNQRAAAETQERSDFRSRYPATSGYLNC